MNYLAHLYLSAPTDDALLGSLLGDFVKGPLDLRYGAEITRAIDLHRKIDAYTDAHPLVMASKSRVSPARRRFAGIMVDMFYDHFLARHWSDYSDEPLADFTGRVYALLDRRSSILPERLAWMAPRMAATDWLGSYAQVGSIHTALDRMGERLRRENRLLGSAGELETHYAGFEEDFRAFLPQVAGFSRARHAVNA